MSGEKILSSVGAQTEVWDGSQVICRQGIVSPYTVCFLHDYRKFLLPVNPLALGYKVEFSENGSTAPTRLFPRALIKETHPRLTVTRELVTLAWRKNAPNLKSSYVVTLDAERGYMIRSVSRRIESAGGVVTNSYEISAAQKLGKVWLPTTIREVESKHLSGHPPESSEYMIQLTDLSQDLPANLFTIERPGDDVTDGQSHYVLGEHGEHLKGPIRNSTSEVEKVSQKNLQHSLETVGAGAVVFLLCRIVLGAMSRKRSALQ